MQTQFRQGIIRRQNSLQGSAWIAKTSLSGNSVDINADYEPIIITLSHYGANYIIEEPRSIVGAWGSGSVGSTNGALPTGTTSHLFWDVNLATGALTRGWTAVAPVVSSSEPSNPAIDTHWFDLSTTRMRVFSKIGNSSGYWLDKVRVFAAEYNQNAVLLPYPLGSQVSLTGQFSAGNLMLGTNNMPLKQSDGTFATTATSLIIQQTSGQNVQFDASLIFAMANESIPAFHLVSFVAGRNIKLASSDDAVNFVSGIVIEDLYSSEVGQVIANGTVRNDQWSFTDGQINMPLFCGPSGQLQPTPPSSGFVQQVGIVYDVDSIYMNIMPPIRQR